MSDDEPDDSDLEPVDRIKTAVEELRAADEMYRERHGEQYDGRGHLKLAAVALRELASTREGVEEDDRR